jgi:hypothetical protein
LGYACRTTTEEEEDNQEENASFLAFRIAFAWRRASFSSSMAEMAGETVKPPSSSYLTISVSAKKSSFKKGKFSDHYTQIAI